MGEALEPADIANKSVTKAVGLLRVMAAQPRTGATATTLAKASGISRPTAFRLLYSLERTGLVDRVDNKYTLGWELARLGRYADPYAGLVAKAASSEASPNPAAPISRRRRRPTRSPSAPIVIRQPATRNA